MTRLMTRGDIFRQQAIRCARATCSPPPDGPGRAAPPASTESNVVEFRRRLRFHTRPTDVFPAEPPPTSVRAMPAPPFLLGLGRYPVELAAKVDKFPLELLREQLALGLGSDRPA